MSMCGAATLVKMMNNATPTAALETIGGLRTRQLAFNAETVDVTNSDSTGKWRELLASCGVKSATISGSGVLKDNTASAELMEVFIAGSIREFNFIIGGFGEVSGDFQVTSLQIGAEYNGAVSFDLTAESSGEITFAAE